MLDEKDFFKNKIENEKEFDNSNDVLDISALDEFKKKYIAPKLVELNLIENNNYLNIMINDIINYKKEKNEIPVKDFINYNNTNIFKNLLYNNLEKNLVEISYIYDKEKRNEKINKIYEWYKDKKNLEKDIKTITYKSYKEKDEISKRDFLSKKLSKNLQEIKFNKNPRNLELIHRNKLDEYKRRKLRKPFYALKKSLSFCSFNDFNDSKEISYEKYYKNKYSYLTPANREMNSFLGRSKSLNELLIEKKLNEERNKLIAIKRNEEEMKEKIKEFGLIKSKFKENLHNKFEKKNLINLYVNKENLSSFLLKKYNMKEKEAKLNLNKNNENKNNTIDNNRNIKTEENDNNITFKRERSYSYKIKTTSFHPNMSPISLNENEKNKEVNLTQSNKKNKVLKRSLSLKKKQKYHLKKFSLINFSRLINLKLFSGKNNKIFTNQIQNIENDTKNIKSTDKISIKEYKIKFPEKKSFSELMTKNKKEKNIDAIPNYISKDILNKRIFNYRQLCKINTNEEKNNNDSDINKSLSKYNYEELSINKTGNHFEKLRNKYNKFKDNLLKMRLSMSFDKKKEYENLMDKIRLNKYNNLELNYEDDNYLAEKEIFMNNSLFDYKFKRKNQNINYPLFHALVNPNDNFNYSKNYLPRNGSLLLFKLKKNEKKKKKKKRKKFFR